MVPDPSHNGASNQVDRPLGRCQVVGQPQALQVVSDAVRVARAGLQPPDRPLGVFLFVGPTGVGKTQLTKALAHQLFDSEEVTAHPIKVASRARALIKVSHLAPGSDPLGHVRVL